MSKEVFFFRQCFARCAARFLGAAALATLVLHNAIAGGDTARTTGLTNEFFAMDPGLHGEGLKTPESKAEALKGLGYAGLGWTPPGVPGMLQALRQHGLKMSTLYVAVRLDEGVPAFDPQLPETIKVLKGQGTILWLQISSKSHPVSSVAGDERAVAVVRELAALAQACGLSVALYPHAGAWLERVQDAVRVVRKVDRSNAGITFNVCHCLKVGDEGQIPALLEECRPYLFVVTINGAEHEGDWSRLIQPLDRGSFDLPQFLGRLKGIGYTGPIGLQHFGVKGDARENLRRSMASWRLLSAQVTSVH